MYIFYKSHSLSNDFVIFDLNENAITKKEFDQLIANRKILHKISNRYTGIGCDTIIAFEKIDMLTFKAYFWNMNGSEAKLCGNGLRCIALLLQQTRQLNKVKIKVENFVFEASCEKGKVKVKYQNQALIRKVLTLTDAYHVDVGNEHIVLLRNEKLTDWHFIIEKIRQNFDDINVMWIYFDEQWKMQIFERGVGVTQACGSGALAAFNVLIQLNYVQNECEIIMQGGILHMKQEHDKSIVQTGHACIVYKGEIELI